MAEIEEHQKLPNRLAGPEGYKDKTILITGGTGFLGKVLVEKLLRTCPELKRIYLLIRTKKRKNPQERIKELFTCPLYDVLKNKRGTEILNKVTAISGDVCELDLGLTKEDRRLLTEEVEIVFHLAATVRFDEPLKKAVFLNTRGTKFMLDLGKECKKLLVFCHVSTAYCHLNQRVLFEKAYPPPADPHNIIKMVECWDDPVLNDITKKLLGDCPNTYSFTKALGEGLVNEETDNLPVIIVRPSLVIPIWKEPLRGWTATINGPVGLLVGAGKGLVRSVYCNSKSYADFIPADVAINSLMVATFDFMTNKTKRFFNCTTSSSIKITWEGIIELGKKIVIERMPLNWVVWYPGGSMKKNKLQHQICAVFFHYIPALVLDFFILISGNTPVLWRIHKKISKGLEVLEYYGNHQWDFNNDGLIKTIESLNEREKELYGYVEDDTDIEDYLYHGIHAVRLYVLNESDETLPAARRHMKIMWVVDKVCKTLIVTVFVYYMMKCFLFPFMDF